MIVPSPEVLDLFVVPGDLEPVAGGAGGSFRAGDLVLTPGRDPLVAPWLDPVLARLSVRLDESPTRRPRDLRVALPVPARDGSWVVEGWGATRFEPGTTTCDDLEVTLAAGRVLHAQLAATVLARPAGLDERTDPGARAERLVFGPVGDLVAGGAGTVVEPVVREVGERLDDSDLGPDQLVHVDLARNVLLDGHGAPLVTGVVPAWRPPRWAEAVAVLDAVLRHAADREVLGAWTSGAPRQAMLRAIAWRALVEPEQAYGEVLSVVAAT